MIERFIHHLVCIKGYSNNTARAYEEDLRAFARYAKEIDANMTWSKVTKGFIESYVYAMHDADLENTTISRRISSLRTYYRWAISTGLTKKNPAQYISSPKKAKTLPHTIDTQAIKDALYMSNANSETKALIAIAYETGMRLQEMLDMNYKDIDMETRSIRVHGKGNKERIVYFGSASATLIEILHDKNGEKLFTCEQREARATVYKALKPYTNAEQLSPHAIRHTYATEMLNNGASIKAVSQLLGHESVKTTEIYAQMAQPTLFETYQQTAPRA